MMYTAYWAAVAASAALSLLALRAGLRRAGFPQRTFACLAVLSVLLGALGARAYYLLAHDVVRGFSGSLPALLTAKPYELAMGGALLGVLAALPVTARLTRCAAGPLADALAPAGLLMIALARAAECLADFGWGRVIGTEALRRIPFGVQDAFGEWHCAVFWLEALCALGVLLAVLRRGEGRFSLALLMWAATQIVCESLRAETLRWGFVRVQQVQCAVMMLCVLMLRTGRRRRRVPAGAWAAFCLGAAAVVLMEFALDKSDWPHVLCYAVMALASAAMAAAVHAARPGKGEVCARCGG